jgi:hypothetical protein
MYPLGYDDECKMAALERAQEWWQAESDEWVEEGLEAYIIDEEEIDPKGLREALGRDNHKDN